MGLVVADLTNLLLASFGSIFGYQRSQIYKLAHHTKSWDIFDIGRLIE